MILDARSEFADAQDIPAAGTTAVGDVMDISTVRDIGAGTDAYWYVSVDEAGAGGTSANIRLVTSDTADLATPTVIAETGVVATASLTLGARLAMKKLPAEGAVYKRYIGIDAVVVGTFTAGQVSSGLTLDEIAPRSYPDAVN